MYVLKLIDRLMLLCLFSDTSSQKDHQIGVGDQPQVTEKSLSATRCDASETEMHTESRMHKPATIPRKTDGEISLNLKWITDVDRIHVSDEKRKQMMKKARAISRAISKKATESKNVIPAPTTEQSGTANMSALENAAQNNILRNFVGVPKKESSQTRWRIPRVQNADAAAGVTGAASSEASLVAQASSPSSKDADSNFDRLRHVKKAGHSREISGRASCCPVTSRMPESVTGAAPSQLAAAVSSDSVPSRVTGDKAVELSAEVLSTNSICDGLPVRSGFSQNLVHVPSREVIERIQSSSKQKSAILLPHYAQTSAERSAAVGIALPSEKNLGSAATSTQINHSCAVVSSQNPPPVVISAAVPSSAHTSHHPPTAAKKRKLNISQYKSILPHRRKALLQSSSMKQTVDIPAIYVYGNCKDVLHDHSYVGEETNKKPPVGNESVLPVSSQNAVVVSTASDITETMPTTIEAVEDRTNQNVVIPEFIDSSTVRHITSGVISSPVKPAKLAPTFESKVEPEIMSQVTNKVSASAAVVEDVTVDCMPAYFNVVSLPNCETKISVSSDKLVTKTRRNPRSVIIANQCPSTTPSSDDCCDNTLRCGQDVDPDVFPTSEMTCTVSALNSTHALSQDVESCVAKSPQQRVNFDALTTARSRRSCSNSASSAISISSSEESSSSSRSSGRRCSTCESSYSSDSWYENF